VVADIGLYKEDEMSEKKQTEEKPENGENQEPKKITLDQLGNAIYLLSKKINADTARLQEMERVYAEEYNKHNKRSEEVK